MKHVTFYKATYTKSHANAVHILKSADSTWCGESIYGDGYFNDKPIIRAYETTRLPTCIRCKRKMSAILQGYVRCLTIVELERVAEYFGYNGSHQSVQGDVDVPA